MVRMLPSTGCETLAQSFLLSGQGPHFQNKRVVTGDSSSSESRFSVPALFGAPHAEGGGGGGKRETWTAAKQSFFIASLPSSGGCLQAEGTANTKVKK